jgi:hypothetical protein
MKLPGIQMSLYGENNNLHNGCMKTQQDCYMRQIQASNKQYRLHESVTIPKILYEWALR